MASARSGGTTRRSSSGRSPQKSQAPEVSPARWAGVALVIAAIVGAIFLAMISPSEPGGRDRSAAAAAEDGTEPSPSPETPTIDGPVPVMAPEIIVPKDGQVTGEYEFAVTVAVPDDRTVARKNLDLHVYNNGQHANTAQTPKPGTNVKVDGIRLVPGKNSLTAVLSSPAGPGPASEPITVELDEELPPLAIVAPGNKYQTYEDSVVVEVTSEANASVTIHNLANDHDPEVTVGTSGKASAPIRLKYGKNRIKATSVDQAGQPKSDTIVVTRLDGRPKIKLKYPKSVDPPEEIRIVAVVTDSNKKPMPNADVHFTLTAPNQSTDSQDSTTNAKGRAVWEVEIGGSSSPAEKLELGVTVISPSGDPKTQRGEIALK